MKRHLPWHGEERHEQQRSSAPGECGELRGLGERGALFRFCAPFSDVASDLRPAAEVATVYSQIKFELVI